VWKWLAVLSLVATKKKHLNQRFIWIWLLYPNILLGKEVNKFCFYPSIRLCSVWSNTTPLGIQIFPMGFLRCRTARPVLPRETHPKNAWKWSYEPWNPSDHTWCQQIHSSSTCGCVSGEDGYARKHSDSTYTHATLGHIKANWWDPWKPANLYMKNVDLIVHENAYCACMHGHSFIQKKHICYFLRVRAHGCVCGCTKSTCILFMNTCIHSKYHWYICYLDVVIFTL